jgi:hypothetical protein
MQEQEHLQFGLKPSSMNLRKMMIDRYYLGLVNFPQFEDGVDTFGCNLGDIQGHE